MILEFLKAIFLGIVEGVTEWLPISSTGHMILVDEFIKLDVPSDFLSMFLVVIQLGAIMAVIILYFNRLNPFSRAKSHAERSGTLSLWGKVIVATIPAGIIGLLLDDWANAHLYNYLVVSIALIAYGIAYIVIERFHRKKGREVRARIEAGNGHMPAYATTPQGACRVEDHAGSIPEEKDRLADDACCASGETYRPKHTQTGVMAAAAVQARVAADASARPAAPDRPIDVADADSGIALPEDTSELYASVTSIEDLSYRKALLIGLFQCLAVVPGTSRSGSTILGGMVLGLSRTLSAEFAFFLAIPIMFGWSLVKLIKFGFGFTAFEAGILIVGCVVSFLVSILAIKFLMNYIKKNDFTAFGWYRIVLGIVVIAYFAFF